MNTQTSDMDVFMRSLTTEQMDACERDEKELAGIFDAGWSERTAVQFHRAMLVTRRVAPAVTVEGAFEFAVSLGLSFLSNEDVFARLMQGREDDVVVYGVQRRDGNDKGRTSGIVSPDMAAPAKAKRGPKPKRAGLR